MQNAFDLAVQHQQAGRLLEARELCRQLAAANPADANVLHLAGMVESQLGEQAVAVELLNRARQLQPANPYLLNALGTAYGRLRRYNDAEKCLRNAVSLKPDLADAHNNLGNALTGLGRLKEAEQHLREALAFEPAHVGARINLGVVLRRAHRLEEAEQCYRAALSLAPNLALAHSNLGNVLMDLGRLEEAPPCFERAVALQPGSYDAQFSFATALMKTSQLGPAEERYRRVLAIRPDSAEALTGLGNVLQQTGKVEDAEKCYRKALALEPLRHEAHWALLFTLNFLPHRAPAEIFAEHRAYTQRFYRPASVPPHENSPDPDRKLRIGYVSGDLRDHPVGQFIAPVLAHHERGSFEISCYYNFHTSDGATARLKRDADHWRDVMNLNDEALVEAIRRDGIDILVDLNGHTGNSRLHAFAHKPAPVQATWLGYLNTTGMPEMDYRITDPYACPEGMFDEFHSERLMRLPGCQWCFEAPADGPPVAEPPSLRAGHVTFACFSSLAKIGPTVIELWSRLLLRVPDSRLLIVRSGLSSISEECRARFARYGVAPERIDLRESIPFREYLALYSAADVVLDTFPYTGGTTTCHALWMGVPVVTLTGVTATSRGGASLLHAVGLDELVAATAEEYLDTAAALAQDRGRLAALRSGMRERMAASPLMDAERFTRDLERAYRNMWRTWCANRVG